MAKSLGSTNLTVMTQLRNKVREYAETMSLEQAFERARNEVSAEMDELGPDPQDLTGSLQKIWEFQSKLQPSYSRPEFLNGRTDLSARYSYTLACREAMLRAYSDNVMLDVQFTLTARELIAPGELTVDLNGKRREVSPIRWMQSLMQDPAKQPDAEAARRSNEKIVLAAALCEKAITPEKYIEKQTAYYVRCGKPENEAAALALADSTHAYDIIYDALIAKADDAMQHEAEIVEAGKNVLAFRSRYEQMVADGQEQEARDMLYGYYSALQRELAVSMLYNIHNDLDDIASFGKDISSQQKHELVLRYEGGSMEMENYTLLAAQAANPYYAILDIAELYLSDVHSFIRQPGEDPDYSYLYDCISDNTHGIEAAVQRQTQKMLTRYGLQEHDRFIAKDIRCKADPAISVISGDGRTVIVVTESLRLENGEYKAVFNTSVPGRYMDAGLIADVQALREAAAKIPAGKNRAINAAAAALRSALDDMAGMTLGDSAADDRMQALSDKLAGVQVALIALLPLLPPAAAGAQKTPLQTLYDRANAFISEKTEMLETIRLHKQTAALVAEVEAKEREALAAGGEIPEEDRALTPMQRYLKPIEQERARLAAEAAAAARRAQEEKERIAAEEALREGQQLDSALRATEEELKNVRLDATWQTVKQRGEMQARDAKTLEAALTQAEKDLAGVQPLGLSPEIIGSMLDAFAEGSRAAYEGALAEKDADTAAVYAGQLAAAETLRKMYAAERAAGGSRIDSLLQKNGLSVLADAVAHTETLAQATKNADIADPAAFAAKLPGIAKNAADTLMQGLQHLKKPQDVILDMIGAFIDQNREANRALFGADEKEQAKVYGKQAVGAAVVQQMVVRERACGSNRLESLLEKGGFNQLVSLVMTAQSYREYEKIYSFDTPNGLDRALSDPVICTGRVAFDILRKVQTAQENALKNSHPQAAGQPAAPQSAPRAPQA